MPLRTRSLLFASLLLLTACNTGTLPTPARLNATTLPGSVHGGQQPITAATINLYAVNQTTDGGPSTSILNSGVVVTTSDGTGVLNSNANPGNSNNTLPAGYFNINNSDFSCPTQNTLVYITSGGGNPGLAPGTNNTAIQELAALGTCSSIQTLPSVTINEATTVGTIAALYPYTSAYNAIGAANQTNLANAFALVNQYVNISTGTAPGPALPAGSSASTPDLYALANVLATCINSSSATSSPCSNLFALSKNTANTVTPTDTLTSLLNIRLNPTRNVAAIFNLQNPAAPFAPTNSAPPADYTLPITTSLATAPVFSLAPGPYPSVQSTTITDADSNAKIYYTMDGSTPGPSSILYTSAVAINQTETLMAIAIDGSARSTVSSATYTLSNITPTVSLTDITAPSGSTTPVTLTASSNANGSVVTFSTANGADGSFTPTTCTITAGACSVSYNPTGTLATRTYTGGLTARLSAAGSFTSASTSSTLTVVPAYVFNLLSSFTGTSGAAPGNQPIGNLVQATDGSFYGKTSRGGPNDFGDIFNVTPAGAFTRLYSFANSTNMAVQNSGLVQGSDANFYGTTYPPNGNGTIFKFSSATGYTDIHNFQDPTIQFNGSMPYAGLAQASDGTFYGTTDEGGAPGNGSGIFYSITANGTFSLLHSFNTGSTEGGRPFAGVVQGTDGNFYGSTSGGGSGTGAFFKLTPAGALTPLHKITSATDGKDMYATLIQGSDGNFYGTFSAGGGSGFGTVFRMNSAGSFNVLHTFTGGTGDGATPYGGLLLASDGNYYGTTGAGGANNLGTVFRIDSVGNYSVLHSFAGSPSEGASPRAGLVQGSDGLLYGTTFTGGTRYGTIFTITHTPALPAPVTLTVPASVTPGASFTLGYAVSNAYSATLQTCTAFNSANQPDWTGPITGLPTATNITLTAPATPGTYTYGLQCGGQETGFATLSVQ